MLICDFLLVHHQMPSLFTWSLLICNLILTLISVREVNMNQAIQASRKEESRADKCENFVILHFLKRYLWSCAQLFKWVWNRIAPLSSENSGTNIWDLVSFLPQDFRKFFDQCLGIIQDSNLPDIFFEEWNLKLTDTLTHNNSRLGTENRWKFSAHLLSLKTTWGADNVTPLFQKLRTFLLKALRFYTSRDDFPPKFSSPFCRLLVVWLRLISWKSWDFFFSFTSVRIGRMDQLCAQIRFKQVYILPWQTLIWIQKVNCRDVHRVNSKIEERRAAPVREVILYFTFL